MSARTENTHTRTGGPKRRRGTVAILWLAALLLVSGGCRERTRRQAARLYEAGRYREAVGLFDRLLEERPGDLSAWQSKGFALAGLRDYEGAEACHEAVLELDARNLLSWKALGDARVARGDFPGAVSAYGRGLEALPLWKAIAYDDPSTWEGWVPWGAFLHSRGIAYWHLDSLERADEDLTLSLSYGYLPVEGHYWRGLVNRKMGRAAEAALDFRRAWMFAEPGSRIKAEAQRMLLSPDPEGKRRAER